MERRQSEPLGQILARLMAQSGLQSQLSEYRLLNAWPAVAGIAAQQSTRKLFIRQQTLYVQLDSPALRADLNLRRSQLTRQLNEAAQAQVITDIAFL